MSRQFGSFIEQAEADQEDPKAKRLKMIKRQVLQKKVQAVRQGAGEDIVASHEPEGEMVEGVGDAVKKGIKRHKDAVEKKKIKNRKAVPYAALAAEHQPEGEMIEHHQKDKDGKVIEHDDEAPGTPSSVEEELSRRSKPSAKAKMAKLDAVLKRREERKIAEKEALKTEGWLGKKKKPERKAQKAQDAGARLRRKVQRREYADKISGSEDNVPDDLRDHVELGEATYPSDFKKGSPVATKKKGRPNAQGPENGKKEIDEGLAGRVAKAAAKGAGKAVGFAAKALSQNIDQTTKSLSNPDMKPKIDMSSKKKESGASAAKTQADKAQKARLEARKKAIKKIKDDRRERASKIMTADKAANKVKKEAEDKKFKADSGKPIVAEFVNNLWEASHKCKKCGKVYTGSKCSCGC